MEIASTTLLTIAISLITAAVGFMIRNAAVIASLKGRLKSLEEEKSIRIKQDVSARLKVIESQVVEMDNDYSKSSGNIAKQLDAILGELTNMQKDITNIRIVSTRSDTILSFLRTNVEKNSKALERLT